MTGQGRSSRGERGERPCRSLTGAGELVVAWRLARCPELLAAAADELVSGVDRRRAGAQEGSAELFHRAVDDAGLGLVDRGVGPVGVVGVVPVAGEGPAVGAA